MSVSKRGLLAIGLCAVLCGTLVREARAQERPSPDSVFLEAWRAAADGFYDAKMAGVDWEAVRKELEPKAAAAKTPAELSAVINEALSRLHASHTEHLTQDQREYYELLDVFYPDGVPERAGPHIRPGPVSYVGIGLATETIDGRVFVSDVYTGGPADMAGILAGDELIGVEGGAWGDVAPFRGREGEPTRVTVQRTADHASRRDISVTPEVIVPHEQFLRSMRDGAKIVERDGVTIGYVRIRSYANQDYHDALKVLLRGPLASADALVIDIRGGWGGASPEYMDIFNPTLPSLVATARDGTTSTIYPGWHKPVAMLIDAGSRSGKEVLAFAFKKHHVGLLVGERSAGAVLGGSPRPLADGSLLYLAVSDVTIDGERLEGAGVAPDIAVKRDLPYCGGRDEQLEAAVDALAAKVKQKTP